MSDVNQFHEQLFDEFTPKKKMPDMLNVLTILTFIGSGLAAIMAVYSFATSCSKIAKLTQQADLVISQFGENSMMGKMMKDSIEMAYKSCELKMPLLLMNIACVILCVVGAMLMRKLNKKGYFVYLIGELVGPMGAMVMTGMASGIMTIIAIVFPIIFLILYATQLKSMK